MNVNFIKEALVVDPVMVSTSGDVLAGASVLASFRYVFSIMNAPTYCSWCFFVSKESATRRSDSDMYFHACSRFQLH